MNFQSYFYLLFLIGISLSACQKENVLYAEDGEEFAGGETTFLMLLVMPLVFWHPI